MNGVAARLHSSVAGQSAYVKILAFAVVAAVLPFLSGTFLANEILVFTIFAVGYHLFMGYTGEVSFGHAVFFGAGAYLTVYAAINGLGNLYLAMLLAVVVTTVLGAVIGYVSLRQRALAFALVTLAFGQMFYTIAFVWTDLTGGDNGLLLRSARAPIGPIDPATGGLDFYLVALVVLVAVLAAVWRIVNSKFGRVLVAIRESEERAVHLGYRTDRYLLLAFVMSSSISAIAGSLYAVLLALVDPSVLFWSTSGDVLLMTVFGGVETFVGPVVGPVAFLLLEEIATELTGNWQIFYGAIIIVVILFFPRGIYGTLSEKGSGVSDVFERLQP